MRKFLYGIAIFLFASIISTLKAQEKCDDCPRPRLIIYDIKPEVSPEEAFGLNVEPGFFKQGLEDNDKSIGCITMLDCHVVQDTSDSGDPVVFSTIVTAPEGAINSHLNPNYIITSRIIKINNQKQIEFELQTAESREVVKRASMTVPSNYAPVNNNDAIGYIIAKNNFVPLFNIIRNFEIRKRDQSVNIVIGSDHIIVEPEKQTVKAEEVIRVNLTFLDCDKQPLKNRLIMLQAGTVCGTQVPGSTGGKFLNESVKTNSEGKATAVFQADDKSSSAQLLVYFDGMFPSGQSAGATGKAIIQINKKPTEKFTGNITATVTSKTSSNSDIAFTDQEKTELTETFSCKMTFNSCIGCIEKLRNPEQRANILNNGFQYGIFSGSTAKNSAGEPQPIQYSGHYKYWSTKYSSDDQMQIIMDKTTEGQTTGYDWFISAEIVNRKTSDANVVYLNNQYWVKSQIIDNIRMYSDNTKYKTTGRVWGKERDASDELKDFSETIDPQKSFGIPSGPDANEECNNADRKMLPLFIENPKEFEEYLLNPSGSYTLKLKGRRYSSEENETSDYQVLISIVISPVYSED